MVVLSAAIDSHVAHETGEDGGWISAVDGSKFVDASVDGTDAIANDMVVYWHEAAGLVNALEGVDVAIAIHMVMSVVAEELEFGLDFDFILDLSEKLDGDGIGDGIGVGVGDA